MDGVCPVCSLHSALKCDSGGVPPEIQPQPPPPASHEPFIRDFGDYELLEEIARGGMGIVYKARQKSLDRIVALKMLLFGPQASPEFAKRFRAEAVLAASLQHPNIVAIHEVGIHEGQQFFVMDYVAGPSLARLVGHEAMDARRAAGYLMTIAAAIHYAHERGILHRDLKPSNVLIDTNDQPRVTDFGLARRYEDDSQVTVTGQVLGSPNYIPPEQALGKRGKVSRQSDVYALGAMLYHLLTGRPPFQGETVTDTLHQVLNTEPLAPRLLNPSLPRDLETICLKCLEKEPARRYATAQALADELDRFLNGQPVLARPISTAGKAWRWCRRQPVRAGLSAALILTFLSGLVGILWQLNRARAGELSALRHAYAGDIKEAQRALEEGDLGGARRTLDKYRPGKPAFGVRHPTLAVDLRGWEWRYLWDQCRSDEQYTLTQRSSGFENLALSSDGSLLAVRQPGGNIDLWDWTQRRHTGTLTNESLPRAMAFVPGGNLLASANQDAKGFMIRYWDLTTRQVVRTMPQPSRVVSLAFSPDGEWMATFDVDPRLRLWSVSTGKLMHDIPGLGAMNDLGRVPLFSPDGATLALGEMNGSIRLVGLKTGLTNKTIPAPTEGNGVMALAFSPDGRLLASGYGESDSTIRLWDAVTAAPAGSLEGHRGWVSRLVFAPDGKTLYSGSSDQTIRVWNVAQKKEIETDRLRGHTSGLSGLALCRDGNTLVSCASDGSIRVWDLKSKRQRASHAVLPVRVGPYGAPFTRDSRHLITASPNDPVIIWDVATAKEVQRLPALGTNHHSVALSPDERLLAVGSLDGTIKIWDLSGRRLVKPFRPQTIPIYGLRFWDRGKTLLSYALVWNRQIAVQRWDVATWGEIPFGRIDVSDSLGLAQSPDGRFLAVPSGTGVKLWDYATGKLKAAFPSQAGAMMTTFSADSRFLAAAISGKARVWEVDSGREMAALSLYANDLISVAFSPDGQRLVTGGRVGMRLQPTLVVWDYTIQRQLISLPSVGDFKGWIQFSPDGNTLLGLSWQGVADFYRAPSWEEIEAEEREQKTP